MNDENNNSDNNMLNRAVTLCLNAQWLPCEFKTGQEAIISMAGNDGNIAISLTYAEDDDGNVDYNTVVNLEMFNWNQWVKLPVRNYDFKVKTVHGPVRIPTVVIHKNFNENVLRKKRFTKTNVLERDGWVCQYTGQKLTRKTATIDHVIPRSKGGATNWENCVAAHINVNHKKGDRMNHEVGLKLKSKPYEPRGSYFHENLSKNSLRVQDWNYFLKSFDS